MIHVPEISWNNQNIPTVQRPQINPPKVVYEVVGPMEQMNNERPMRYSHQ